MNRLTMFSLRWGFFFHSAQCRYHSLRGRIRSESITMHQYKVIWWCGCFFPPFNAEKMVRAEEREKKKNRGGQRGCLIVFGLYAVFFDWPRNCPADSNLIRHPQIKHGSSSSKQKRSNTALPNKQSALYFHLFLSFIYFIFYFFSSILAIWNGNRLAGRYVKAKEMSEF